MKMIYQLIFSLLVRPLEARDDSKLLFLVWMYCFSTGLELTAVRCFYTSAGSVTTGSATAGSLAGMRE